jgi:hypothetical protein
MVSTVNEDVDSLCNLQRSRATDNGLLSRSLAFLARYLSLGVVDACIDAISEVPVFMSRMYGWGGRYSWSTALTAIPRASTIIAAPIRYRSDCDH